MATNLYPCSQDQLYASALSAWHLYLLNIGDFSDFRKANTTHCYEQAVQEIQRVQGIVTINTLKKEQALMKRQLVSAKKEVLFNYKCLQEFATYAKKSGQHITIVNYDKIYRKASNNNWHACYAMAMIGLTFINKSLDALMACSNMPDSFVENYKKATDHFEKLKQHYYMQTNRQQLHVSEKISGSNKIYTDLTAMLRHAQLIYRDRPDMQALFQFDKLLRKTKAARKQNQPDTIAKTTGFFSKVAAMF